MFLVCELALRIVQPAVFLDASFTRLERRGHMFRSQRSLPSR